MFGRSKKKNEVVKPPPDGVVAKRANAIASKLVDTGIDGVGKLKPARDIAEKALAGHNGNKLKAIDTVVRDHMKLVGAEGFVTNLGGFVTMPVALPANVVGFYTLATRMVASIAVIEGYDLADPAVRSDILVTLVGQDPTKVIKGMGAVSSGGVAGLATRQLPPAALAAVNKAIAFRLAGQVGQKSLANIPKAIPVAGGVIGGALDLMLLHKIAKVARREFGTHK